jgi:hypothetical protein
VHNVGNNRGHREETRLTSIELGIRDSAEGLTPLLERVRTYAVKISAHLLSNLTF